MDRDRRGHRDRNRSTTPGDVRLQFHGMNPIDTAHRSSSTYRASIRVLTKPYRGRRFTSSIITLAAGNEVRQNIAPECFKKRTSGTRAEKHSPTVRFFTISASGLKTAVDAA